MFLNIMKMRLNIEKFMTLLKRLFPVEKIIERAYLYRKKHTAHEYFMLIMLGISNIKKFAYKVVSKTQHT